MYLRSEYEAIKARIEIVVNIMNNLPLDPTEDDIEMFRVYKREFNALQCHVQLILKLHPPKDGLRLVT